MQKASTDTNDSEKLHKNESKRNLMSCFCAFQSGDPNKSQLVQFPLHQLKKSAGSTSIHLNSAKCVIIACVYICIRVIFSQKKTNHISDANIPSYPPLILERKQN